MVDGPSGGRARLRNNALLSTAAAPMRRAARSGKEARKVTATCAAGVGVGTTRNVPAATMLAVEKKRAR